MIDLFRCPARVPFPGGVAIVEASLPWNISPSLLVDPDKADVVAFAHQAWWLALRAVRSGVATTYTAPTTGPACSKCSLWSDLGHPTESGAAQKGKLGVKVEDDEIFVLAAGRAVIFRWARAYGQRHTSRGLSSSTNIGYHLEAREGSP